MDKISGTTTNASIQTENKHVMRSPIEMCVVRKCQQCSKDMKNLKKPYLMWRNYIFCDAICTLLYQKQNTTKNCANCIGTIESEQIGKYSFYYQFNNIPFCSRTCYKLYLTRKICHYCSETTTPTTNNFCSYDCRIKHIYASIENAITAGQALCGICQNITYKVINVISICGVFTACSTQCFETYKTINDVNEFALCRGCKCYFNKICVEDELISQHFCSKQCKNYCDQLAKKEVSCGYCSEELYIFNMIHYVENNLVTYFCNIYCYSKNYVDKVNVSISSTSVKLQTKTHFIIKSQPILEQSNIATLCTVQTSDKASETAQGTSHKSVQTDCFKTKFIPVPVPLYIPIPALVYSLPVQKPKVFPISVPIPVLIPLTKNSSSKVFKNLKNLLEGQPIKDDVFENASKIQSTPNDLVGDIDMYDGLLDVYCRDGYVSDDDLLLLADSVMQHLHEEKEFRRASLSDTSKKVESIPDPRNKISVDMGCNAFAQWYNCSKMRPRSLNKNLLTLSPKKLNKCLILLIQELKKPNGNAYSADIMYFLCMCIQKYLFEHGRYERLFEDICFDGFRKKLHEKLQFYSPYVDSQLMVIRIEEEHLWETKQLGKDTAKSLIFSIMYFIAKYSHLVTRLEHFNLKLDNIQKATNDVYINLVYNGVAYMIRRNEDNPHRCPVNFFETYLSKLPIQSNKESIYLAPKNKVLESNASIWYNAEPLNIENMDMMLCRINTVKEILQ